MLAKSFCSEFVFDRPNFVRIVSFQIQMIPYFTIINKQRHLAPPPPQKKPQ